MSEGEKSYFSTLRVTITLTIAVGILLIPSNAYLATNGGHVAYDYKRDDLRIRISSVDLSGSNYAHSNNSRIRADIYFEFWNTHDRAIKVSGDSCLWDVSIDIKSAEFDPNLVIVSRICDSSDTERELPPGSSRRDSLWLEMDIFNYNISGIRVPDSEFIFTPIPGTYANNTDFSFGMRIVIENNERTIYPEPIPENWGEILHTNSTEDGVDFESGLIISYLFLMSLPKIAQQKMDGILDRYRSLCELRK